MKRRIITGENLYEAFCEGRFEEIYPYCMRDVKVTRNVWRKMNFTYPAENLKHWRSPFDVFFSHK